MGKRDPLLDALAKATVTRTELKQKHPEFIAEDESGVTVIPSTTEEHLKRASKKEKERFKVTPEMRFEAAKKAREEGELS